MDFSLLQDYVNGDFGTFSPEQREFVTRHHPVFFEHSPESFAALMNQYPDSIREMSTPACWEYLNKLRGDPKRNFAEQQIFPRFFESLSPENQRALAGKNLIGSAAQNGDFDFFDSLLALFPEAERPEVLKKSWERANLGLSSQDPPAHSIAMLRKMVALMGYDAVREAETASTYRYSLLKSAAFEQNAEVFEILSPIIPDSETMKEILTDGCDRVRGAMKVPLIARKIIERAAPEDLEELLFLHDGFAGACLSGDVSLVEELWEKVPPESRQDLLISSPSLIISLATEGLEEVLNFLLNHAAPGNKMALMRGEDGSFEAVARCLTRGHQCLLTTIAGHLSEDEIAEILTVVPAARLYLSGDDAIDQGQGAEIEPAEGSRLWYQLHSEGKERWLAVTGADPPHESLSEQSPYRFSPNRYFELLPICQLACELERTEGPELQAFKLSILFRSVEEARKYVDKYCAETRGRYRDDFSFTDGRPKRVHDACLFDIPVQGIWHPQQWAEFLLRYPDHGRQFIGKAAEIEADLKEHGLPFPTTLQAMREASALTEYESARENPEFAQVAKSFHVTGSILDICLRILRTKRKTEDLIPDITIDGKEVGHPGYYLHRLPPDDPRALILGHILNCCQSIGKAGAAYAVHSATSKYGGVYVWQKLEGAEPASTDPIAAGSWVWIGSDGAFVFDSFERLGPAYNQFVEPFLIRLAVKAKGLGFEKVRLGCGGGTPALQLPKAEAPSRWVDFEYSASIDAQFDSKEQYEIPADASIPA